MSCSGGCYGPLPLTFNGLEIYQGATFQVQFTWTDSDDNSPVNLTATRQT